MKKIIALVFAVSIIAACKTPAPPSEPAAPQNPNVGPRIEVRIPELFSPDPDIANDMLSVLITINHPVPIKDWNIEIQPNRRQGGQSNQRQGEQPSQRQGGQSERRQAGPFFEQSGTGTPPKAWKWNGRGSSGEMVQSATDYQFALTVNDIFDNASTYEGIIAVDIIVRREGDVLRIIVPSIVFPPDSSDFSLLTPEETRANARILGLIARALNKFEDYKITVEGHANPTTPADTAERNTEETGTRTVIGLKPLSEDRAKAVVDYLANNNGINRERLSAAGVGGTRTVVDYDDEDENWKNRRVEFILQK